MVSGSRDRRRQRALRRFLLPKGFIEPAGQVDHAPDDHGIRGRSTPEESLPNILQPCEVDIGAELTRPEQRLLHELPVRMAQSGNEARTEIGFAAPPPDGLGEHVRKGPADDQPGHACEEFLIAGQRKAELGKASIEQRVSNIDAMDRGGACSGAQQRSPRHRAQLAQVITAFAPSWTQALADGRVTLEDVGATRKVGLKRHAGEQQTASMAKPSPRAYCPSRSKRKNCAPPGVALTPWRPLASRECQ